MLSNTFSGLRESLSRSWRNTSHNRHQKNCAGINQLLTESALKPSAQDLSLSPGTASGSIDSPHTLTENSRSRDNKKAAREPRFASFPAGEHSLRHNVFRAEVAELADAHGSGPCTRKGVGVRVPSSAPNSSF